MDIQSHIMRFRKNRQIQDRSNPIGKVGLLIAGIISILSTILVISLVYQYSIISESLPPPELMENLLDSPQGALLEPTKIYDQSGQVVLWRFENPTIEYRQNIRLTDGTTLFYSDIPEEMVNAAIVAVDPDYFSRPANLLRNIWNQNPDPIPEILVSELLLWDDENHPYRNVRINLVAAQVVSRYGRQKVLEWFLNNAYFGNQIYGVNQAAQFYFGKRVESLDLAESALLAGVIKYPSLNPFDAPTAAKENQESILDDMRIEELISPEEALFASQKDLVYADPSDQLDIQKPVFVEIILDEASEIIPQERLVRGGFNIISSLHGELQREIECTADVMLRRVYGEDPQLEEYCQAARLLPRYTGPYQDPNDFLAANLVLLDPQEGYIVAMVDRGYSDGFGSIIEPKNAGSLITPFIYLSEFTQGFEPASLTWDIPLQENLFSKEDLHPGCNESCDFLGPVSIRTALGNGYLSPAINLWNEMGQYQVNNTLALFGFSNPIEKCPECLYFPGSYKLEMIDIAQGYGVFANQGILRGRQSEQGGLDLKPSIVFRVEDSFGNQWLNSNLFIEKKVISEQLAYLVNHVLADDQSRANLIDYDVFRIGRPAGVLVGTVEGDQSSWVVGYTPQAVLAVWTGSVGYKEIQVSPDYRQISTSLWRAITQYSTRDLPVQDWDPPEDIITLDVCYPSGFLPSEHCPRIVREIFIQGNEPQQLDTLYQVLEINKETGLLASVFTPSEQIEERVYLTIPPEAAEWAVQMGISIPPDVYDLENIFPKTDGFIISHPENFSVVSNRVNVLGSIPEDDFVTARLQYGKGMNPASWIQIGSEIVSPVENDRIGTWDTTGLTDGLYALQIVLVREGQQVEKRAIVISVDNTPPEIQVNPGLIDQKITYEEGKELLFQPLFENDKEIHKVYFYLNAKYLASREVSPFVHPWVMEPGEFELKIVAVDQANNQASETINFTVIQ